MTEQYCPNWRAKFNSSLWLSGDHVWKGFHGQAELINSSFKELDEHHHLGHVDAAFRMHYPDDTDHHDHTFFFLVRSKQNSILFLKW